MMNAFDVMFLLFFINHPFCFKVEAHDNSDDGENGSSSSYVSSETDPELDDQAHVDDHNPSTEAVASLHLKRPKATKSGGDDVSSSYVFFNLKKESEMCPILSILIILLG